jgi:imidazolonepropionase-like amidohydrolase
VDKDGGVASVRTVRGRLGELGRGVGRGVFERVLASGDALRARRTVDLADEDGLARGAVLLGTIWPGGTAEPFEGAVVVDDRGTIDYLGPARSGRLPADLQVLGGGGCWIGPGVVDAHVHLAFGSVDDCLRRGLVGVRDLGAPTASARGWRTGHRRPPRGRPFVAVAGPILTAPRGYPSRTGQWGSDGFATFVDSPGQAKQVVHRVIAHGADVVKIALEPGGAGWPVPEPAVVRAVVESAHDAGLSVVAHALRADMVRRAIDGGVDELAHTPTERLPDELVEHVAEARVAVVSTLQTFFSAGSGRVAAGNAAALHRAGVVLRYGTDLGNSGTRPGVDPRELDRLADAGLGRLGALRAATEFAAQTPGMRRRSGHLRVGEPAALVVLPGDPLAEPGFWRAPIAVLADGRLIVN